MITKRMVAGLGLLLMAVSALQAQSTVQFIIVQTIPPVTVQAQPAVTVKFLGLERAIRIKPSAAVILFAGGNGLLDLQADDTIPTSLRLNFLVRTRATFPQRGLFAAVVDTPNQVAIN